MDIIDRFNIRLPFIDLHAFPIPASYAGFEAASMHVEFSGKDFDSPEWTRGLELILTGLSNFARRWSVAGMFVT
jgi:hypothetical protein